MISRSPLLSSLAASLALCALHASISIGVARPRRRIDFSRLNSSRVERPFESFAGGLLSVFVAMRADSQEPSGTRGVERNPTSFVQSFEDATDSPAKERKPRVPQVG